MKEFDWVSFHKDLDMALAILIQESISPNIFLPSKVSGMEFVGMVNEKRKEQETLR